MDAWQVSLIGPKSCRHNVNTLKVRRETYGNDCC